MSSLSIRVRYVEFRVSLSLSLATRCPRARIDKLDAATPAPGSRFRKPNERKV
jgi:hypothetical protein